MRTLTETRKADRVVMAERIAEIARQHGAAVTVEHGFPSPRSVTIEIKAARGLEIGIDFDGESNQPDVYCLPWCISVDSDARLADRFAPAGYSVNPHHFRKSTQFAHGFVELCDMLARGLDLAASGEAFDLEREAAKIAKNGTAAEQAARFDSYADSLSAQVA